MKLKAHYYRLIHTTKSGRTTTTLYAGPLTIAQIRKAFPFSQNRLRVETIKDKDEVARLSYAVLGAS